MRTLRIATKRAVLLQEWRAAQKVIERDGICQLSAAAEAGRLLAKHEVAIAAHTLCELASARQLLAEVVKEEGGAIAPGRNVS